MTQCSAAATGTGTEMSRAHSARMHSVTNLSRRNLCLLKPRTRLNRMHSERRLPPNPPQLRQFLLLRLEAPPVVHPSLKSPPRRILAQSKPRHPRAHRLLPISVHHSLRPDL